MNDEKIYVVKGTRFEIGEVYPELGTVRTRILGYANGDEEKIREKYDGKGYMKIEIEPIEVEKFEESEMEAMLA